jgi:hypothetical protein
VVTGLATVVALAAVAGCASGSASPSSGQLIRTQVPIPAALLTPDGRHVVVPVNQYGSPAVSVAESRGRITLTLILASRFPASLDYPRSSATAAIPYPLGNRLLIDGSTGQPIATYNGQRLYRVTYLPPGYQFSEYLYDSADGWQRVYRRPNDFVDIRQVPASPNQHLSGGQSVTVSGRPAVLSGSPTSWLVTWQAGGYRFMVSEYDDSGASLPAASVLRIASGMAP